MRTQEELNYHTLVRQFHRGCVEYDLIAEGDRILVALSGGKDSLVLTRLLAEQSRLHKPHIEVAAAHVVMDNIAYEANTQYLEDYCKVQGIPFTVLHTHFDASTDKRHTPCFLCARYRRRALFEFTEAQGFNKLALGHHQDDILTTLLMNMTFEGRFDTMRPCVEMEHYPLSIIRPLCLTSETLVKQVAEALNVTKQKVVCPHDTITQRAKVSQVFHQLEELNEEARYSLWHSFFGKVEK